VNDPSGTGGVFDLRLLPLNNVEQIEILKGSQSTLYGTDAIAGVINIRTRNAEDGLLNGSARVAYGSWNSLQASAGVNSTLHPNLGYTLTYQRESSDGFSAAADPQNTGTFGNDGFRSGSFYGKLNVKLPGGLSVSPYIHFNDFEGDFDDGSFQDADNEFTIKMINPGLQAAYSTGNITLNGGYQFTRTERSFITSFGRFDYEGLFHNADLFGTYAIGERLQVLGGLNYQQYIIPETDETGELDSRITSPYATLYLKNLSGFNAELGMRLNSHTEYGNNTTYSFAPSYNITDNVKLFASITTGFKAPTLSELFGPFGANPDLEPQTSRYLSAGLEAYLLRQTMTVRALWFNREIDDLIVYVFPDGFINRDRQNDSGFELSADWVAGSTLRIGVHYNYTEGELTTPGAGGEAVRRDNLIRRPKHHLGLRVGVNVTRDLLIRLDGEYNGQRSDLFFNPVTFEQEDVTLDPYTLVNLYAEYSIPGLRAAVFADVRNLFDTDFTELYGFNTAGLAVKGGIRVAF
jgi:vitamin B12 transporter